MHTVLRQLHQSNKPVLYYPKHANIDTAIYDLDKRYIFGSFRSPPSLEDLDSPETLVHIEKVEPYYLGAAYLLIAKKTDFTPVWQLQRNILLFMLVAGIFFTILGYFLGKLFVAPMRQSIEQMNHFIQDTTHELNTPISTILTNIEMLETFEKCTEGTEELKRIEIASRTLSRIYDDLTYLNLNHHYHRKVVTLNMSQLVEERLVYFKGMAEARGLTVEENIEENVKLTIDKNDAIRLVDNIISNAIKYNRVKGTLYIELNREMLSISDTGMGIHKKDLETILQRFKRANKSEGGFGIGLDIVNQVVKNYGFKLKIDSIVGEGTRVRILWEQ